MKKLTKELIKQIDNTFGTEDSILNNYEFYEEYKLPRWFIIKYKNWLNPYCISMYQNLSESFIEKHTNWLNSNCISTYQNLSESFIEKHIDWLDSYRISKCQNLSEPFIEKHINWLDSYCISMYQNLSESFIEKHKDFIDVKVYKNYHIQKTDKQKKEEAIKYAKKHKLKYDDTYIYAYRNHDKFGRGSWNKTITYRKGKYYKDWHCDTNKNHENSFGLGIWPKGNTAVKVKLTDWGTEVKNNADGKARVWGFEII